jgi:hypothetical protein
MVDPAWQDAATSNAERGYPWAVWMVRDGGNLSLFDSKRTKEEAEACKERCKASSMGRPTPRHRAWTFIVVYEGK